MINDELLVTKIALETAKIYWRDLQRFFASGTAIAVDKTLDLTQAARVIAQDDAKQLRHWMDTNLVDTVTDEQAKIWYEQNALMWAVVVKPWVLVQSADNVDAS